MGKMRSIIIMTCTLILVGCDPQFPSGDDFTSDDAFNDGSTDDSTPPDPCANALPDGLYEFSVSMSPSDPLQNMGDVSPGPLDLYLWLVTTDRGLSAVEFDIQREGAELRETYFTPQGSNLFLTWEGSGEVDLAIASCPTRRTLLGTFHLDCVDDSIQVSIVPSSLAAGAVDCGPCYLLHSLTCAPFIGH